MHLQIDSTPIPEFEACPGDELSFSHSFLLHLQLFYPPKTQTSIHTSSSSPLLHKPQPEKQRIRKGRCRAELIHDAPFVVAIGASVINSLVFPLPGGPNDTEDGDSVIDSADARFAVMGIIIFIPYFNWMSWVFAWMDTIITIALLIHTKANHTSVDTSTPIQLTPVNTSTSLH